MGYILPMTYITYQSYQDRRTKTKSPHVVDKPYKVLFHVINREHEKEQPPINCSHSQQIDLKMEHTDFSIHYVTKQQKAALTGKGNQINSYI